VAVVDVHGARQNARAAMVLARLCARDVDPKIHASYMKVARWLAFAYGSADDLTLGEVDELATSAGVDLTKPLTSASNWIIDNRDSNPLFLYFFGYISNAVVISVRAVYLVLLAAGWAGVTALGALVAWRVAGVRLALGTGARGYMPKTITADMMVEALKYVAAGGTYVPPQAEPDAGS